MSVTVSFRITRRLKEKMDKLRGEINWSEEVRRFIQRLVAEHEQRKALQELEEVIKRLPEVPRGTATGYVREDRDSG